MCRFLSKSLLHLYMLKTLPTYFSNETLCRTINIEHLGFPRRGSSLVQGEHHPGHAAVARAGSRDTTLIVWDVAAGGRAASGRAARAAHARGEGALPLRPAPRHVLAGHRDAVVCLALAPELDLCVSAAADGTVLFHTLAAGRRAPAPSFPEDLLGQPMPPVPALKCARSLRWALLCACFVNKAACMSEGACLSSLARSPLGSKGQLHEGGGVISRVSVKAGHTEAPQK